MCMKAEAQGGPEGIRINAKKKKKKTNKWRNKIDKLMFI